jgi:FlaA1/EpsC-like NDP-sugar epimerase
MMLNRGFKNSLLKLVFSAPRRTKQLIVMTVDITMMMVILHLAMIFRLGKIDIDIPIDAYCIIYGLSLIALIFSGVYRMVLRTFDDRIMKSVLISFLVIMVLMVSLIKSGFLHHIPRTIPFVYLFLLFIWMWSSRIFAKYLLSNRKNTTRKNRILIYGAGQAGRQLLSILRDKDDCKVIGFIDDDVSLMGGDVSGLPVFSGEDLENLAKKNNISSVLLAMPSTSRAQRRQILDRLEPLQLKVQSLPSVHQLVDGKITVSDINEVDVADLLGRDPVPPIENLLYKNIKNKVVLVTGAGGSIGSELCRQIVKLDPQHLVILEQCEYALYNIEQELKTKSNIRLTAILGSVLKEDRLKKIMITHGVKTVYHAAAYKHVPLVEMNPFEGVINNTLGTARCARAALIAKVETFVLISTDKAVRPTNVMGASKRLAELACQALAGVAHHTTQFSMVRFGNVLGSSGSVVPLFRQQILQGGPITVTHPDITRYFMTIPEAAQLVIQAGAMGVGGDVFLLDMGEPVKISDLAKKMILLSGLSIKESVYAVGDIEIQYSGLRPGEKLYEELLIDVSGIEKTAHRLIMRSIEKSISMDEMDMLLNGIMQAAKTHDLEWILSQLERYVDGYHRSKELSCMPVI